MTIENWDRRLAAAIGWSFAGLAFFLPLLLSTRSSEVFELPKMVFVYAMTAVIVGLWIMRMGLRREILIRRTPLDIPILLFLISQMAATIYSIDPYVSWWGWYGRFHGGLWSTISYTLLYYALVSNVDSNEESPWRAPRRLLILILSSAVIVGAYAILQHFGIDKNFWVQDVVNRVFSTQGQPNWLAGYLVMAMPLAFAMIINSSLRGVPMTIGTTKQSRRDCHAPSGLAMTFLLMIFFLALLWTKSRSGLLGLLAADTVFWLALLAKLKVKSEKLKVDKNYINDRRSFSRYIVFSFVLIHGVMLGLILATNNPVREALLKNGIAALRPAQSGLARNDVDAGATLADGITLRKSEYGGTESGDIRRIVWSGAIELVKRRPWLGTGPETFGESYWWVRPKEHNLTSEWNFLYNKAHNEWLNLAANTGVFGLGSHLLLVGWFTVWSLKELRSIRYFSLSSKFQAPNGIGILNFENSNLKFVRNLPACNAMRPPAAMQQLRAGSIAGREFGIWNLAILAGLLGVEAVNFFGFSTVTVGVYRYLFMGLAVSSSLRGAERRGNLMRLPRDVPDGTSLAMTGNFVAAVGVAYILTRLFIFFLADLSYNRGRMYQDAGYIEEAVKPLMRAVNLAPGEPVFRAELAESEGVLAALVNFEIVRKQSPNNLGFIKTEARVLFNMRDIDPKLGEEALQLMKAAITMAPTDPRGYYQLGIFYERLGDDERAKENYQKALELKSDYEEARAKLK